ncbi:MAG: hypothetical protein JW888_13775 [Pirellulales bacterium]|nr:hypothetical protein [Pirellulales bacterium]
MALGLSGGTADITFIGKITQSKNAAAMMTIGGGHAAGTLPGEGTGTVTFSEYQTGQGIATASMGTGLQFSNADGTYDFNHKVAVSGAAGSGASEGVSITNGSDGTITFDRIMLTNVNGVSFNLNGGTADVDFKGKITQDANNVAVLTIGGGHAVGALPSEGNGTVEFTQYQTGQGIVTASMGTGLHLNQANGDYDFSHLVDINGSTATGINIQSSNGAVTFASATIDGTSSHGVSITDSANVSLSNVDINGVGGEGIHVDQSVSSTLVISNCDINTTGTNRGINMIVDSGASTSRITLLNNDVSAQNAEAVLLDIPNNVDAKTVYYLMQNNSLANTSATAPVADLDAHGNVLLNATVSTNTFNGPNVATAFTTTSNDASTTIRLKLNGNTLASTGTNIVLNGSTGTFSVEDVATISADNNGASETHAGCTNDPGGIPTP